MKIFSLYKILLFTLGLSVFSNFALALQKSKTIRSVAQQPNALYDETCGSQGDLSKALSNIAVLSYASSKVSEADRKVFDELMNEAAILQTSALSYCQKLKAFTAQVK